ncbi:MAG: phosphatase PAP2 family protein [Anaerolineales bacterium]|nr:phosphatase PAP2 family protein [Anaerolineales bacterium]
MIEKLSSLDAHYTQRLRLAEKQGALRVFSIFLAHSGDSWFWILALIPLALLGRQPYAQVSAVMLAGILVTAALVFSIKLIVRRRRPEGEWGQIYRKTDPHSFPSGHAARAALLAVLGLGLGPTWLGLILLIWAPLVIFARVAMGLHYVSDVLIGALLGALIGLGILAFNPLPLTIV